VAKGRLDIGAHWTDHWAFWPPADPRYTPPPTPTGRYDENFYQYSIVYCKDLLNEYFGDLCDIITSIPSNGAVAYPGWLTTTKEELFGERQPYDVVMETYDHLHTSTRAKLNGPYNTLDPGEGKEHGQWHHLCINGLHDYGWIGPDSWATTREGRIDGRNADVDRAIERGEWLIIVGHGIDEGYGPITYEEARILYEHIAQHQAEGVLWVATATEATKYIKQRQAYARHHGSLSVNATMNMSKSKIDFNITYPESALLVHEFNKPLYKFPLTVKVEVPDTWTSVKINQAGKVETAATFTGADGKKYVFANVVPNEGSVKLTNAK